MDHCKSNHGGRQRNLYSFRHHLKAARKGLIAGTYIGQEVLKTTTGNVTIPVSVTVGDPVFVQLGTVTFNTTRGVNPKSQSISVASTGTAIRFTPSSATGKGGSWLHVSPSAPLVVSLLPAKPLASTPAPWQLELTLERLTSSSLPILGSR